LLKREGRKVSEKELEYLKKRCERGGENEGRSGRKKD
jgi:hypothetical protein